MTRSCGDCVHYRVCYVARAIRDLYHGLRGSEIDTDNYDKLVAWAREFAEYCRLYERVEK